MFFPAFRLPLKHHVIANQHTMGQIYPKPLNCEHVVCAQKAILSCRNNERWITSWDLVWRFEQGSISNYITITNSKQRRGHDLRTSEVISSSSPKYLRRDLQVCKIHPFWYFYIFDSFRCSHEGLKAVFSGCSLLHQGSILLTVKFLLIICGCFFRSFKFSN